MDNNDALRNILTTMIAGDREGAVNAATQALDAFIHDFIFPDEAAPADDMLMDPGFDAPLDDVPLDDAPIDDVPLDDELPPVDGEDAPLSPEELDLDPEAHAFIESLLAPEEDNLEVPGSHEDDVALDVMSDELSDVPASDVVGVEELPAGGEGDVVSDARNIVDVAVDPEQSDETVSAVKVIYDDDTDFTFFTFSRDAEQVVALVRQLCCGEGGVSDMSVDDLTAQLKESFVLL